MKITSVVSRLFLAAAVCTGGAAAAWERGEALVLGDSVAFSFIASVGVGYHEYFYTRPDNFIGFPEHLGDRLNLQVVNGSCPGESTGSFLSATAPDNGCRTYRSLYPLHAQYGSTQLAFATAYLKTHREVRLVTITLGANDALLLEESCASSADVEACIAAGAPAMLAAVAENIAGILGAVRASGYAGPIVLTNYYSLDYSDAAQTALTADLNAAIAAPASAYGAVVADVFSAFQSVAAHAAFGGKTCNTGLLNPDVHDQNVCNIHPAQTGHRLIATTIEHAL